MVYSKIALANVYSGRVGGGGGGGGLGGGGGGGGVLVGKVTLVCFPLSFLDQPGLPV